MNPDFGFKPRKPQNWWMFLRCYELGKWFSSLPMLLQILHTSTDFRFSLRKPHNFARNGFCCCYICTNPAANGFSGPNEDSFVIKFSSSPVWFICFPRLGPKTICVYLRIMGTQEDVPSKNSTRSKYGI